jgi:predicted amidohydrolase YtcJ
MELIVEDAVIIAMDGGGPRSATGGGDGPVAGGGAGPATGGGTGPAAGPRRSAMLVRDGRIAVVGTPEQVRGAASRGAATVRLDGATVVPGLIDAHCHVADVGYLATAADCSQPSAPGIAAVQSRMAEAAARTPPGSWVTGSGYVEYKLAEHRHPTRADLDQAVPDRPAVLYHTSLHACVLNTAALREAGFADGQPDPPGGAFGRDSEGRLDGVVFEGPMFALFERNLRQDLASMGPARRV